MLPVFGGISGSIRTTLNTPKSTAVHGFFRFLFSRKGNLTGCCLNPET